MAIPKQVLSYMPDADPSQKGVIVNGSGFVPTNRGIAGAPSAVTVDSIAGFVYTVSGMATLTRPDGSIRMLVGEGGEGTVISNGIIEVLSDGSHTAVCGFTSGTGAVLTSNSWCFCQAGEYTFAASPGSRLRASTSATAARFTNTFGSGWSATGIGPCPTLVESLYNVIFTADFYENTVNGDYYPDGWWASSLGVYVGITAWEPSIATQCAKGRLRGVPGKITALRRFGSQIFIGKKLGCYLGSYVGGNQIWDFESIPCEDGPVSQNACIFIGTPDMPVIFFVGYTDIYVFDGARPRPIGGDIREWFYSNSNASAMDKCVCVHDALHKIVYVYFPSASSPRPNDGLAYHYPTNRWGRCGRPSVFGQSFAGTVYAACQKFDSNTSLPVPVLALSSSIGTHQIFELRGTALTSSFVVGSFGDGDKSFLINEVKPTWIDSPETAHATFEIANDLSGTYATSGSASMTTGKFDILTDGHWHRITFTCVGDYELNRIAIEGSPMGSE